MNYFKILICLMVFFSFTCFNGLTDMYKWVDENGVVHYSDTPPPSSAPKKSEVEILPTVQSTYVEEPPPDKQNNSKNKKSSLEGTAEEEEKKTKSRPRYSSTNRVELFSTSWCVYCKHARKFFESRGIAYTEYDVEKDKSAQSRFKRLNKRGGVPFAIINGQYVKGFSASQYEAALIKNQ